MTKSTYKVLAETGYDGHAKDEEFQADLDEETEARHIERGDIKLVSGKEKK